ncbi:MAG TPA: hypothetical protein PK156_20355 [Polyangium sp.]|nr:hypothetical protein [Polyangium sp.]
MSDHSDSSTDPVKPEAPSDVGVPTKSSARSHAFMDALVARWPAIDRALFPAFALGCTVYSAVTFYGYMHVQTRGDWSAPLDDVFIHFDYARAAARGFPFEWSEGNGFSSGNTSILYPFVLAIGYVAGFRSTNLMVWAAFVAIVSMLLFFVAVGRAIDPLSRAAKYLVPPAVLSMGALAWSLWSGMENAFHLGMWALMLLPAVAMTNVENDLRLMRRYSWLMGFAGMLVFLTRPESVVCIAAFAFYAAVLVKRAHGLRAAVPTLFQVGLPGATALVAQSVANRVFTGEWSAAGAIVKLAINQPYMTAQQKFDEWWSLLEYVVKRNTQHHFSEVWPWGWLVPLVALVPFFARKTRGFAVVVWAQIIGWALLVALNGQVRWQNERYTMSGVAWLFVLAATGLGVLIAPALRAPWTNPQVWAVRVAVACGAIAAYWQHQIPQMRDQIWFFGRASRNIRDQHIVAGKVLARQEPPPNRVLVGDAGALIYASDRPGLDLIGLGGYHDLPFARAGVHGLGASIELIERMDPVDRPDYMALYPSWWGDLPSMFGKRVIGIPVVGNVICGGAEKVLYKANWSALEKKARPRTLREGEDVIDELDVGDLVSERAHLYNMPKPGMGFVVHRVLPEPGNSKYDLFDAGRIIPIGEAERATFVVPQRPSRLVVRVVPAKPVAADVHIDGKLVGRLATRATTTWSEVSLDLPSEASGRFALSLTPVEGEWVTYHVWIVASATSR